MNYSEALDFAESGLYGHFEEEDYMKNLLLLFNSPQKNMNIIHIAGTNGKGTTGFFLSNLLIDNGYKIGHFMSPHLSDYRERMKLNGKLLDKSNFIQAVEMIYEKKELIEKQMRWPTYFEMSLLIALLSFKDKIDYLIMETGIGGKEDATNQIGNTILSIITTIGYDHTHMLGSTLEEIAGHKAGIIKEGVPVLSLTHDEKVDQILRKTAIKNHSKIYFLEDLSDYRMNNGRGIVSYEGESVQLNMAGVHQIVNSSLAIKACEIIIGRKFNIDILSRITFEGRMEFLMKSPNFIVDGAHNEEGIEILIENLGYLEYNKLILILGTMKDKEVKNFSKLVDKADFVILTKIDYIRAQSPEELLIDYKREGLEIYYEDSLEVAVDFSQKLASPNDLILCTGSLYLIGDVRNYLNKSISMDSREG